jgi:cyanate lyase
MPSGFEMETSGVVLLRADHTPPGTVEFRSMVEPQQTPKPLDPLICGVAEIVPVLGAALTEMVLEEVLVHPDGLVTVTV